VDWVEEIIGRIKAQDTKRANYTALANGFVELKVWAYEIAALFKAIGATKEEAILMVETMLLVASDNEPSVWYYHELIEHWVGAYFPEEKKDKKRWRK